MTLYFNPGGRLSTQAPVEGAQASFDEYISDPNRPVPYLGYVVDDMTFDYMTDDQRFAAERPDVLVYETEELTEDLTISVDAFNLTDATRSEYENDPMLPRRIDYDGRTYQVTMRAKF